VELVTCAEKASQAHALEGAIGLHRDAIRPDDCFRRFHERAKRED
jgi:hypothetical protein